jgi:hypothetical protein
MVTDETGPPVVAVPERIDRRMRLGPFPSARDALKFLTYAAVGALLAPFVSPWVWLPVVLGGFALSVWRPEGQSIEERAASFVAWKIRSSLTNGTGASVTAPPIIRQGLLELAPHHYVAVVRTGGTPVAYLPPDQLAARFETYRDLLRSLDGSFAFLATTAPIRSQAVRPSSETPGEMRAAAAGYTELVTLICRRRHLRRVYFVLATADPDPDAIARLEGRVATLIDTLVRFGLRPTRLRDRSLFEAAHRFGWPARDGGP